MPKQKKASALLFSTILLFVVLSMVISLSYVTVMEQKMSQKTKSSVGSFFSADSGVEWALNKIAYSTNSTIVGTFGAFNSDYSIPAPSGANYKVYLLDANGKVITADGDISNVKAVRSVGTDTGQTTQRAIEAAVAAGGGQCYVSYGPPPGAADSTGDCVQGFTNEADLGAWGSCGVNSLTFSPPNGGCLGWGSFVKMGEGYLCCK